MTSKLTREWLQHQISAIEAVGITDSNTLAEFKLALAAMDSEPVGKPFMYGIADPDGNAYIDELCVSEDLGLVEDTVNELNYDREEGDELNYSVVALYRHAQPAPVVLDERAAFNAWNNEDNLPIAGVGAKNAAWLAWQARALLCGNSVLDVPPERPADSSDGDDVGAWFDEGWNACRAAMLQAGNSPLIPEGYVMVPKEPTDEMIAAAMNCEDVLFNSDESFCVQFGNIYEAMLAAAPQEVK